MITILGPTASGKTKIAALTAHKLNGEIISADSRQVYKGMDIGTGKDLDDYIVDNKKIPFHLIDIVEAGYEYNVFEFQKDFLNAYQDIVGRNKIPILCGGTGMYIDAVLKGYKLIKVPENVEFRKKLKEKNDEDLIRIFKSYKSIHNVSDTQDRNRLIKAIEIQEYYKNNPKIDTEFPKINTNIFGINFPREIIRKRITERLKNRLEKGMLNEINNLLNKGLSPEQLKFYGLEYKFLTQYILGEITYDEMFSLLNIAIHQFSKRQMTWFRRMEKSGFKIHWIEGNLPDDKKLEFILKVYFESRVGK